MSMVHDVVTVLRSRFLDRTIHQGCRFVEVRPVDGAEKGIIDSLEVALAINIVLLSHISRVVLPEIGNIERLS